LALISRLSLVYSISLDEFHIMANYVDFGVCGVIGVF